MRAAASSVHASVLWGADLLVTATALSLVQHISLGGTMWLYAAVNLASVVFVWFCVPETSGASLEDIENALREGEFRPTAANGRRIAISEDENEPEGSTVAEVPHAVS